MNEANVLKITWINMLLQVPGLTEDKVRKIVDKFPTYRSLVQDAEGEQKLKDLALGKKKLGLEWAKKIFMVFAGVKFQEAIMWACLPMIKFI